LDRATINGGERDRFLIVTCPSKIASSSLDVSSTRTTSSIERSHYFFNTKKYLLEDRAILEGEALPKGSS